MDALTAEFEAFTDGEGRFRLVVPLGVRVDIWSHRNPLVPLTDGDFERAEALNIDSGTKNLVLKLAHRP
jgi:hypothetical protein